MSDFYKQFETPLDKAVDKAIAEQNERFLADPEAQRRAEETGDRWRAIFEAEEAVGSHGVVLPVGLAQAILDTLEGKSNVLTNANPDLPAVMLRSRIKKAARR